MDDVKALLERARSEAPATRVWLDEIRETSDRRHGRRRLGATVVGLAITAAIVSAALVTLRNTPGQHAPVRFGSGPTVDLTLQPGQYFYQEISVPWSSDPVQSWWATDNSGRLLTGHGDQTYEPGKFLGDAGDLTYLSTDPATLDNQLRNRVEPGGRSPEPYQEWPNDYSAGPLPDQEGAITWGLVRSDGELLLDPNLSPEQHAALFEVAANLQGMKVTPDSTDPEGRPGILLSIVTEDSLHEWWFDPQSYQLLAMRDTDVTGQQSAFCQDPPCDPSSLIVVKQAGVADSTDSTDLARSFIPPA